MPAVTRWVALAAMVAAACVGPATESAAGGETRTKPTAQMSVRTIVPRSGLTTGGTRVVIRGNHLVGVRKVTFGGVPGTRLAVKGQHRLVVRSPLHAPGVVRVRVHHRSGSVHAGTFSFASEPPDPSTPTTGGVANLAPVPAGVTDPTARVSWLQDVDCASEGHCFAVGTFDTDEGLRRHPLIEEYVGGVWTGTEIPVPADAEPTDPAGIVGISCGGPSYCLALGWYYDSDYDQAVFTAEWTGDGWGNVTRLAYPTDTWGQNSEDYLWVNCPEPGWCAVGGRYEIDARTTRGVVATLSDGQWSTHPVPLAEGAVTSSIGAIDCPAAGVCTVVGSSLMPDFGYLPYAASLVDGTWTASTIPLPPDAQTEPRSGVLNDVDCPSPTSCTAVGRYAVTLDHGTGLVATTTAGGPWQVASVGRPPTTVSPEYGLYDVDCSAPATCAAVGSFEPDDNDPEDNLYGHTTAVTLLGTVSSSVEIFGPEGGRAMVRELACRPLGACAVVGNTLIHPSGNSSLVAHVAGPLVTSEHVAHPVGTEQADVLAFAADGPTTAVGVGFAVWPGSIGVPTVITGMPY